ncbi:MAG: hypothetical protein ACAI44_31830 [Candidatus Sericytochromatia bacterium]
MKSTFHQIPKTLLAASLLLAVACQPAVPPTPIKPSNTPSSVKPSSRPAGTAVDLLQGHQIISGQLLDAKTHQRVQAETAVRVTGPDAAKVESTSFQTSDGQLGLVLKKGVQPSATAPLHLTVVADAKGYFTGSTRVDISDNQTAFALNLTSTSQPPNGVGTASDTQANADASGMLTTGINLQANAGNAQASFFLNSGTQLTDANGQPLTGPLQTQVGYFSNTTEESTAAFPGGFLTNVNINGASDDGYFVTGGFVSVDITDASGKKAAQFSKPANVTIQIPAGTINPETGKPVQSGDKIGIWSHNTTSGKWSQEGEGTAVSSTNGNFNVNYDVNHLSYWNLDWFNNDVCNPVVKLGWDSANHVPVHVDLKIDGLNDASQFHPSSLLADEENELFNVPLNKSLEFTAHFGQKQVGQTTVTLDQSCGPITLNISTADLPKLHTLPVKVTLASQTAFTREDVDVLCDRFGVSDDVKAKVLAYTHPGDPNALFTFNDKAVQDVQNLGVSAQQAEGLKFLLSQTYDPSGYLSYYIEAEPESYAFTNVTDGTGQVTVFDNQEYVFGGQFYFGDHYYYIEKKITIKPGDTEVRVDLQDVELTIEIVKGFLAKLGIQLPQ